LQPDSPVRGKQKGPPWGSNKKSDWDRFIKNFDGSKFDSSAKAIKYTISINLQPYFTIHIQLTYWRPSRDAYDIIRSTLTWYDFSN
jgi:hypothetical protein